MKTKLKYFAAGAALLLAGACKHMEDVQPQVSLPQSIKVLVQQDAGTSLRVGRSSKNRRPPNPRRGYRMPSSVALRSISDTFLTSILR